MYVWRLSTFCYKKDHQLAVFFIGGQELSPIADEATFWPQKNNSEELFLIRSFRGPVIMLLPTCSFYYMVLVLFRIVFFLKND